MSDIHSERILILDFGSQYTQLIARRVREAKVYCEIHPVQRRLEKISAFGRRAIILSGGPASVYEEGAPLIDSASSSWACRCSASATACSSSAHLLGGQGRAADEARVRPRAEVEDPERRGIVLRLRAAGEASTSG